MSSENKTRKDVAEQSEPKKAIKFTSLKKWKLWMESRNIAMVLAIDYTSQAETTSDDIAGTNDKVKLLCNTLVKCLPSNALLFAGVKKGTIDRFICKEPIGPEPPDRCTRQKNPNRHSRRVEVGDKKQGMSCQTPPIDKEVDEVQNKLQLSMYHQKRNIIFETDFTDNNQQENQTHKERGNKDRQRIPGLAENKTKSDGYAIFIRINNIDDSTAGNHVNIRIKVEKEELENLPSRIKDNLKPMKGEWSSCERLSTGQSDDDEDNRCKLIRKSIFKLLNDAKEPDSKDKNLMDRFIGSLYDDDLLKLLLDQASKGKFETLQYDKTVNEPWIDELLKKTDSYYEKRNSNKMSGNFEFDTAVADKRITEEIALKSIERKLDRITISGTINGTQTCEEVINIEESGESDENSESGYRYESDESYESEDSDESYESDELSDSEKRDEDKLDQQYEQQKEEAKNTAIKYKLLFIWCAHKDIDDVVTMKFWKQAKNNIAMALLAYKVCRNMSINYEGGETGDRMKTQMKRYGVLAIRLLGRCFYKDEGPTFRLLTGRIKILHNMTPFDIALDANFYKFIAQKPCRMLLDRFWTKPLLQLNKCYYLSFVVSMMFPLLSPFLMKYDNSKFLCFQEEMDEPEEEIDEADFSSEDDFTFSSAIKDAFTDNPCDTENLKFVFLGSCRYYCWLLRLFLGSQIVRFIYSTVSHLLYLILFSFVMLIDFGNDIRPTPPEMVLDAWTLIMAIEEIKQVVAMGHEYLDNWNLFDCLGFTLFLIGFVLRIIYWQFQSTCPECMYTARIIFAFSLMLFILRTLQLMSVESTLGPKIYMIHTLLKHLVSFMLILAVFILAYGIGSNIILYPKQPLNFQLLLDIINDSFWLVLQQFNREDVSGSNCNKAGNNITAEYCSSTTAFDIDYVKCKENKCPANNWIVAILMVIYAVIAIVMMLNVLIAMFNDTFSRVHEKKEEVYNLQAYRFMREFCVKSILPVPLCVITYWSFIPWCIRICSKLCSKENENDQAKENSLFKCKLFATSRNLEKDMMNDLYNDRLKDSDLEQKEAEANL